MTATDQDVGHIVELAAANGLAIDPQSITFNEMGLDSRVGFATSADGQRWVLRIPRRPEVIERAKAETKTLDLLRSRLPIAVPHCRYSAPT